MYMNKQLIKKLIGTTLVVLLAGVTLLIGTGNASALFVFKGNDLDATGTVTSVDGASFDIETSGSDDPFTIVVNRRTKFSNGYNRLSDLQIGDAVRVKADREDGDFIASKVRATSDPSSYGGSCDNFVLRTAVYTGPNGDSFYATKDGVQVRIYFDTSTEFRRGSAASLLPGTEIRVTGEDCTADGRLVASTIVIVDNIGLRTCRSYGRDAIVLYNQSPLIANDSAGASLPVQPATVPAGRYKLIGVSFDNHSGDGERDRAQKEQWYFTGLTSGAVTYTSGVTRDLPNNRDFNATVLAGNVTLPALDQIQLKHAAFPDANSQSIYPVCVVLQPRNQSNGNNGRDRDDYDRSNRLERDSSNELLLPEEL